MRRDPRRDGAPPERDAPHDARGARGADAAIFRERRAGTAEPAASSPARRHAARGFRGPRTPPAHAARPLRSLLDHRDGRHRARHRGNARAISGHRGAARRRQRIGGDRRARQSPSSRRVGRDPRARGWNARGLSRRRIPGAFSRRLVPSARPRPHDGRRPRLPRRPDGCGDQRRWAQGLARARGGASLGIPRRSRLRSVRSSIGPDGFSAGSRRRS